MVRVRGWEALPLLSLGPRKKRRGRGEGRCSAGDFQSEYPGRGGKESLGVHFRVLHRLLAEENRRIWPR
jgi:hypothetical protein